jgi:hypothetical protein
MIAQVKSTSTRRTKQTAPPSPKFQVGDRVEIIRPDGFVPQAFAPEGETGTIVQPATRRRRTDEVCVRLDQLPAQSRRQEVQVNVMRLKLLAPEPEKRIDLLSIGEGDRVRGKTLKGDIVEGLVKSLGIKYVKLDTGKSVWVESVEMIERAALPIEETDDRQVVAIEADTIAEFQKLISCDVLTQDKIRGTVKWDNREWVVTGSCNESVSAVEIVPQKEWEGETYSYWKLPKNNDGWIEGQKGQLVKHQRRALVLTNNKIEFVPINDTALSHLKLLVEEVCSDLRWVSDTTSYYAPKQTQSERYKNWEFYIERGFEVAPDFDSVDLVQRSVGGWWAISKGSLMNCSESGAIIWAKQIIDQIEVKLSNEPEQSDLSAIAETETILSRLKKLLEDDHAFAWMGNSATSGYADEDLESYKDWEIYLDIPNGGMLAVDLIHRPTSGWWGFPTEGKFSYYECDEAIAWAKQVIDQVEHQLNGLNLAEYQLSLAHQVADIATTTTTLDAEILAKNAEVSRIEQSVVIAYFELGQKLRQRRNLAPHGTWGNYLQQQGIHESRSRRAISIAEYFEIEKTVSLSDLTLTEALEMISQSKPQQMGLLLEAPPEAPPEPLTNDLPGSEFHPQETAGSETSPYTEFSPPQDEPPAPEKEPIARTKRLPPPPPIVRYWQEPEYLATVNPKECSLTLNGEAIAGQIVAVIVDWNEGRVKSAIVNYGDGEQVQSPIGNLTVIQDVDMELNNGK